MAFLLPRFTETDHSSTCNVLRCGMDENAASSRAHGFCVGRRRTSLIKLCGACARIISTAYATSCGRSILLRSFPAWGEKSVATVPGQKALTRKDRQSAVKGKR